AGGGGARRPDLAREPRWRGERVPLRDPHRAVRIRPTGAARAERRIVTDATRAEARERPAGGLFLAFEGVEGSGKSTQAGLLAESLRSAGMEVLLAREPGTTPLGERVRGIVLDSASLEIPPASELFLMLAARAAFVRQVVRPALEAGSVVISDRFELSTLAYQGAGRGVPVEEIRRANRLATGGLSPDATILLTLDPEEGVRRQEAAAKRRDRMEREGIDFHRS